jgi:hypothetical protein
MRPYLVEMKMYLFTFYDNRKGFELENLLNHQ